MKLSIIAVLLVSISSSAFAISTPKLIEACRKAGVAKVISQAKALNLSVNATDVKECGVDNRPLSISSYVWFCAKSKGGEKDISVLTQKPAFKDCF